MKTLSTFISLSLLFIFLLQACGPSEEELRQQEEARRDSLEQAQQAELEQMRQDSLLRAEQDSIAEAEEAQQPQMEFSEDGAFTLFTDSWRSEAKAQAQADLWRERGFEHASVVEYGNRDTGDVWFRIRMGSFGSRSQAENAQNRLQTEHNTASWILKS